MSSEHRPPAFTSLHAPLATIALAMACYFWTNLDNARHGAEVMQWQAQNLATQLENLEKGKAQLAEAIAQRNSLVEQARTVEAQYTSLLTDLLDLAKNDEDTLKVVQKWNIQRQEPGATPAAEAPSSDALSSDALSSEVPPSEAPEAVNP